MEINHNKKMDSFITRLAVLCDIALNEQTYIGNPIDSDGTDNMSDGFVKKAEKITGQLFFKGEVPEWFKANRIPASLLASLYGPDFLAGCGNSKVALRLLENIMKRCVYVKAEEMAGDPYLSKIVIPDIKKGAFSLTHSRFAKNSLFVLDNRYGDEIFDLINIPVIACMDNDYEYPLLEEDGKVWMSIAPCEIVTMQSNICAAHGSVLTFGLGLGYYPYIVSLKENVSHVTVVEKSNDVADLFEEHMLPQMETRDKITIVRKDAFDFVENSDDGIYDTCFSDIWVSGDDLDTYLKMKFACGKFHETETSFWIENRFLSLISIILQQMILHEYAGFSSIDMNSLRCAYPFAFQAIEEITKSAVFLQAKDISEYIHPDNIQKRLKEYGSSKFQRCCP